MSAHGWPKGTRIRPAAKTLLVRWAEVIAEVDGRMWCRWDPLAPGDPHGPDFILDGPTGWTATEPPPPEPIVVHNITVGYTWHDDGIWLNCSCEWRENMGMQPDVFEVAEKASDHLRGPW